MQVSALPPTQSKVQQTLKGVLMNFLNMLCFHEELEENLKILRKFGGEGCQEVFK